MKKAVFIIGLAIISLISSAQDDKEKNPFEIVKSKSYKVELLKVANSYMNSFSNQMNLQGDGYFFRVNADSLHADVPFVGKMTSPSPGLDTNAILINGKIKEMKIRETGKGKKLQVTFQVYSDHSKELFDILMTVTESGSTDLMFRSSKRDNITFLGDLYPLD